MGDFVRAVVTESGGEVSASVEETNRIRAALGLRPLDTSSSSGSRRPEVVVHVDTEAAKVTEQADIRLRIERSRRDREEAEARGRGLGDVLKARATSAADWVNESRRREAADKARAARVAALQADDGVDGTAAAAASRRGVVAAAAGSELAGMKIHHDADAFGLGESAVLTLADRPLLDEGGTGLSTREDELVSADLVAAERAAEASARRANARNPIYSGRDDGEWGPPPAGGAARSACQGAGVLPQYDAGPVGPALGAGAGSGGLVIGSEGRVDDAAAGERVKARLAAAAAARAHADVSSSLGGGAGGGGGGDGLGSLRLARDYLTPEEVAAAAAARAAAAAARKRRRVVRRPGDDAEDAPPAAPTQPDDKFKSAGGGGSGAAASDGVAVTPAVVAAVPLPVTTTAAATATAADAGAGGERDRGSRARRTDATARAAAAEAATQSVRAAAFDSALRKAEGKSAAVFDVGPQRGAASAALSQPQGQHVGADAVVRNALHVPQATNTHNPNSSAVNALTGHRVYKRLRAAGDAGGDADDDDAELNAALARARRLAQATASAAAVAPPTSDSAAPSSTAQRGGSGGGGDAGGAGRVAELLSQMPIAAPSSVAASSSSSGGGGIVFTDTTEFARLLQGRMGDEVRGAADAAAAEVVAEAAPASSSSEGGGVAGGSASKRSRTGDAKRAARSAAGRAARADPTSSSATASSSWVAVGDGEAADSGVGGASRAADDADEDDDDAESGGAGDSDGASEDSGAAADTFTGREPSAMVGVAGALALFARTGALVKREMYRGRTKDARPDWDGARGVGAAAGAQGAGHQLQPDHALADIPPGMHEVVLEYRDKEGNKLTPKEAYRELCYKFHGRQPSQKTRDKRLKAMLREQALSKASSSDTPLGSLGALLRSQETRGSAAIFMGK